MPTEPTHVASPALAGPTIPVPPPMPKGEKSLAAASLLSEQLTTPASLKAQVEDEKQGVENDERATLLSSIRGFKKENLKQPEKIEKQEGENDGRATLLSSIRNFDKVNLKQPVDTKEQSATQTEDADKGTLLGVLKTIRNAKATDEEDDDSGFDDSDFDEWNDLESTSNA